MTKLRFTLHGDTFEYEHYRHATYTLSDTDQQVSLTVLLLPHIVWDIFHAFFILHYTIYLRRLLQFYSCPTGPRTHYMGKRSHVKGLLQTAWHCRRNFPWAASAASSTTLLT